MTRRKLMAAGVVLAPLVILGGLYIGYRLGLRPVSTSSVGQSFTVAPGDNAPRIAQHLADAGLLRSRNSFVTYVNFHGLRARLEVGSYLIAPNLSGDKIAELLAAGKTTTKHMVVPEGYTLMQIKTLAIADGINATDLTNALAAPHTQTFLAGKPSSVDLEGYLFPDSYQLDATTTAAGLVNQMLDNFGRRVGPEYTQAFAAEGLTLHQGLTLASIVEREVNISTDRPIVAQIFLKRLSLSQPLGSDVTAKYAADLLGVPFDVNLNSPYNTRRVVGLPPGPICNPGLSSMDAVAHPATTDYLYFLSGKDGKTYFAKTYAEHQANIAKYL